MTGDFRSALAPYLGFADLDRSSIKTVDGVEQALYLSGGEVIYTVTHKAAKDGVPASWRITTTEPRGFCVGATFDGAGLQLAQLTAGSASGSAGNAFGEMFARRLAARCRGGIFRGPNPGATGLYFLPDLVFATIVTTGAPGFHLGSLGVAPRRGVPVDPNPFGARTGSSIRIRHPDGRVVERPVTYDEFIVGAADVPWAVDQLVSTSVRESLLIPPFVMVPTPAEIWAELTVNLSAGIQARLIGGTFDEVSLMERAEQARRMMGRSP